MMENVMKTEMDALLFLQMDTDQRLGNGCEVDKETAKVTITHLSSLIMERQEI